MDRSETHYVSYDAEETWREMMRAYIEAGGDVLYPGDEKEILMRSVLAIGTAIMAKMDNALRMATLRYAVDDYLKLYGEGRNCFYIDAVAAQAMVEITFRATGREQVIPAGTELTADGEVVYRLMGDIEQTGGDQTLLTVIECATAGTIGNGLHEGAQMQFIESNSAVVSVIVTQSARGGMDAEDMEVYRERIRTYGLASVTTGPEMRYEADAMKSLTRIIDVKALNDGPAEVGIYLLLEEGTDENEAFDIVYRSLSAYDVRPLTDHVTCHVAEKVSYTLQLQIWYSGFTQLSGSIQEVIEAYQKWQDRTIGRAFNPDKLVAMLYQLGVERVRFREGSGLDGSLEYREISERQHCSGSITWEVVNT